MSQDETARAWMDAADRAERTGRDDDWLAAHAAFLVYKRAIATKPNQSQQEN